MLPAVCVLTCRHLANRQHTTKVRPSKPKITAAERPLEPAIHQLGVMSR